MTRPNFLPCFVFAVLVILGGVPVASAHYSPELGRWLERDPIGYVDGMGLYEYVRSSPSNGLDPSGLVRVSGIDWSFPAPVQACIDNDVRQKIREVEAACATSPGVGVRIRCRFGDPGTGTNDPQWYRNRFDIVVNCFQTHSDCCRGKRHSCSAIRQALIHELEHARQACRQGFRSPNMTRTLFYDRWDDSDNQICQEVGAYCSEPRHRDLCECGIPKDEGRFRNRICGAACNSLFDSETDQPGYDQCYARCMQIARDCRDGVYQR